MCLCLTCATTSVLCRVRDLLALGMSMLMLTILIARWGKGDVLEAPVYWRDLDPYWQGSHHLMRRYFHLDGSQTADPDDRVWGGHECCFSTVTTIVSDGKIREHYVRINKWPRMLVSRNEDWSWEMSNHFTLYSSIPDTEKDGGTGPL